MSVGCATFRSVNEGGLLREKAVIVTEALREGMNYQIRTRGLSWLEVAQELGITERTLRDRFTIGTEWRDGNRRRRRISIPSLEQTDSAITHLTDLRGGVFSASGTTPDGVKELRRQLSEGVIA